MTLILNKDSLDRKQLDEKMDVPQCYLVVTLLLSLQYIDADGSCRENIYLEVGKQGVVSCDFENFDIIGWINGDGDVTNTSPFIYLESSQIYGRGYRSGDYDMHPNGSLIINEVKLTNEFNYTVLFVPSGGANEYFKVPVKVYVPPEPGYPVVNGRTNQVIVHGNTRGFINCSLTGIRPSVHLEWVASSDEISLNSEHRVTDNSDGTYNTYLTSRYNVVNSPTGRVSFKCRVAGQMADLFPSVTSVYLLLEQRFPVVNGLANQEHVVLHVNREGELTCSMDKVSQDISLELVTIFPDSSDEILLDNEYKDTVNGDDTVNITLTSSFRVLSDSTQHFTLQCRVSGQAVDKYPEATTVELLVTETTSMLPVPVIDGCYSQPEACTLMMTTEGTITCSVKGVPHNYDLNLDLYTLPDLRCLSLITDRIDTDPSGYYDIITSCRYIVDETFIDTMVHCFLSGTDRNIQPVNSTVKAKIMWQATSMPPVPVIDGCYSQPDACTLMMTTEETITCSVKGVPHYYELNLDLYTLPDLRCLSPITDRIDTHRSGYYDIITSCRYIVDEPIMETMVHCFLSGTDRNIQPVNSAVKSKVMWQATDQEVESLLSWQSNLAIVLLVFLVLNVILFWIQFILRKVGKDCLKKIHMYVANPRKKKKDLEEADADDHQSIQEMQPLQPISNKDAIENCTALQSYLNPGYQTDHEEAGAADHQSIQEMQPLQPVNNKDNIEAGCIQCSHFREMHTKIFHLLKNRESFSDSGVSSSPSSSTASRDPRELEGRNAQDNEC